MTKICKNCGKRIERNKIYCSCGGNSFVLGDELKEYDQLRDSIRKLFESISFIDTSSKDDFPLLHHYTGDSSASIETTLLSDFFYWVSFLAISDGHIAKEEVTFINYILRTNYSNDDILNLSSSNKENYVDSLPPSFIFMHELDLFQGGGYPSLVDRLYDIFNHMGSLLIACDGKILNTEKIALSRFIDNLSGNIDYLRKDGYEELLKSLLNNRSKSEDLLGKGRFEVKTNLSKKTKEKMEKVLELLFEGHSLEEIDSMAYPSHKVKGWFAQGKTGDGNFVDFHNKLIDLRPDIAKELGSNQKIFVALNDDDHNKKDETTLDDVLSNLNNLVGLENVKRDVESLINLIKVRKLREKRGLKQPDMSLHLVFSGNPGTGKTTVARILSECYYKLGILSKGHLVETDRSGLVAGYVGQTSIQTKEVIEKAMGGILFIDEAYALLSKSEIDYGKEAIIQLLKEMEDHRDEFIVILAGYPDLMDEFLKSNPGLHSRINKFIHFDDYNPQELYDIFMTMCDDYSYSLDDRADRYIRNYLDKAYDERGENFANGRTVRNIFEKVLTNQANRIVDIPDISNKELNTLIYDDFDGL